LEGIVPRGEWPRKRGNYCPICGKKLNNADKARSTNAGLKEPICGQCAYDLANKHISEHGRDDKTDE